MTSREKDSILRRMFSLFRIYRLCAKAKKLIKLQKDDNDGVPDFLIEFDVDIDTITEEDLLSAYKIWVNEKRFTKRDVLNNAVSKGYIEYDIVDSNRISLTRDKGGGYDLTAGFGYGYLRELVKSEWQVFYILFGLASGAIIYAVKILRTYFER